MRRTKVLVLATCAIGGGAWLLLTLHNRRTEEMNVEAEAKSATPSAPLVPLSESTGGDKREAASVQAQAAQPPPIADDSEYQAFLAKLQDSERSMIGDEDPRHYYEYCKTQERYLAYCRESICWLICLRGESDPEVIYAKCVERHVANRSLLTLETKRATLDILGDFMKDYNTHYYQLRSRYQIDPPRGSGFDKKADAYDRELDMWKEMDRLYSSFSCETRLSGLLGALSPGQGYIRVEDLKDHAGPRSR